MIPVRVICEEQKRRQQNVEDDRGEEEHLETPQLEQVLDVIFGPAEDSVRQVLVECGILRGAWRRGREGGRQATSYIKSCKCV